MFSKLFSKKKEDNSSSPKGTNLINDIENFLLKIQNDEKKEVKLNESNRELRPPRKFEDSEYNLRLKSR